MEESLEYGDKFTGDYFDNKNNYETDQDDNVLDEAEEFVHLMEVEMPPS